jgi:hypothetical protein
MHLNLLKQSSIWNGGSIYDFQFQYLLRFFLSAVFQFLLPMKETCIQDLVQIQEVASLRWK